jgi:hypothetical protein
MICGTCGASPMDIPVWLLLGGAGILLLASCCFIGMILSDHRQRMRRLDRRR